MANPFLFGVIINYCRKKKTSKETSENAKTTWLSRNDRQVRSSHYYITRNVNGFADAVRIEGGVLISYLSAGNPDSVVGILALGKTLTANPLMLGIHAGF